MLETQRHATDRLVTEASAAADRLGQRLARRRSSRSMRSVGSAPPGLEDAAAPEERAKLNSAGSAGSAVGDAPDDPKEDPAGEAPTPAAEPEVQAKKAWPAAGQADAAARPVSIVSPHHDLE